MRLHLRPLALLGAAVAALPSLAPAETTRRVPEDFATINEAIAAAEPGDTVLVGPGMYRESLLLTETKGDRIVIRSAAGAAQTTIAYGDTANVNEAVVTFQRCSNSTQLVGFSIDGRGAARRGILANSDSKPLLEELVISGCEYAVASHKGSSPYLRNVTATGSRTAGLFISGGSADAKDCRFVDGDKFGVYLSTGSAMVRLRNVEASRNGQVGIQATDSELSVEGGIISGNKESGILLQDASPTISDAVVEGHGNVGVVMEVSSATLVGCTIRNNEYGVVSSIEGAPRIFKCTFQDNESYHLGIEGEANPLVGGSLENANRFVGKAEARVQMSSTARVDATYNFWDLPCAPKKFFLNTGSGKIRRTPWMAPNLLRSFDDCREARAYFKLWKKGKLDDQGNPIQKGAASTAPDAATAGAPAGSAPQAASADPTG
jgi:hypothetical protein